MLDMWPGYIHQIREIKMSNNQLKPSFGRQILTQRKLQKIRATDLAKELDIARSHLYAIESGEIQSPAAELVHRICRRLNIPQLYALNTNELRFKQLLRDAQLPTRAHDIDSGIDIYAATIIRNTRTELWFGTGIAVEIPIGFSGLIFPRSSISKIPLTLANSVGVIDPGYRGEIQIRFNRLEFIGKNNDDYRIGNRVAQMIIVQVPNFIPVWADELEDSERRADGWGSSGN